MHVSLLCVLLWPTPFGAACVPQGLLDADPNLAKSFSRAAFLVLDEADRLLDAGVQPSTAALKELYSMPYARPLCITGDCNSLMDRMQVTVRTRIPRKQTAAYDSYDATSFQLVAMVAPANAAKSIVHACRV